LIQKDQLGDLGLPDVCLTVVLHGGLHYNTFWYCFMNIYFTIAALSEMDALEARRAFTQKQT